jgi:hypothetical protein
MIPREFNLNVLQEYDSMGVTGALCGKDINPKDLGLARAERRL